MYGNVILMDGAMGTALWEKSGTSFPAWRYNIEQPDIVRGISREYIAAGSRMIQANTFCANGPSVKGVPFSVEDTVRAGVRIAREAAAGTGVRVALSIGPLTGLLKPFGDITAEQATEIYEEQIGAGMIEKPDCILLETFMDLEMLKLALAVANKYDVPALCSMSFGKRGKTLMGNSVKAMVAGLAGFRVAAVGLNCSLGPDQAMPVMEQFAAETALPLLFKPNAGMPGENGAEFDIDTFVKDVVPAAELGVTYIGGCCGTSPAYIARLAGALGLR